MSRPSRSRLTQVIAATAVIALSGLAASGQNHAPNPYRAVEGWAQLPDQRTWGSMSAVFPARDGSGKIWVAER